MTECHHELCGDDAEIRPLTEDDEGHTVYGYYCVLHEQFTDGDPEEATAIAADAIQHERQTTAWLQNGGW